MFPFSFLVFLPLLIAKSWAQDSANLICYDCDPSNQREQCSNPVQNAVQQENCGQSFATRDLNSTLLCVSAYITYTGSEINKTGIYRGCQLQTPDVLSFCDWYKEETNRANAILTSCQPCNSTRCNSITFNEFGEPNNNNGGDGVRISYGVQLLVAVYCGTIWLLS